jgi:hypothetical protein
MTRLLTFYEIITFGAIFSFRPIFQTRKQSRQSGTSRLALQIRCHLGFHGATDRLIIADLILLVPFDDFLPKEIRMETLKAGYT